MTRRQLIELTLILARETQATAPDVLKLLRLAAQHERLAVEQCNRQWTAKDEIKQVRVRNAILFLAGNIGAIGAIFSNDPRGATVKLKVKSGRTNDFGQEGICVL